MWKRRRFEETGRIKERKRNKRENEHTETVQNDKAKMQERKIKTQL